MTDNPRPSPGKAARRAARNERLAQALRENLKRRKQRADAAVGAAEHSTTLSGAVLSSKSSARGG